ncbi:hypothetical protein BDV35DRAFT_385863 [Aspergillus flavus]|uniref:Vacuolar ATPase assembly protein VMA22 n=1 Tax=Aspergillus flavus TaxID=5059 RepID=A0A5N6GIT2_ASPFL|nr:hypothetical protein BDV35DRAFT_385863 [Aspergillus flavus]
MNTATGCGVERKVTLSAGNEGRIAPLQGLESTVVPPDGYEEIRSHFLIWEGFLSLAQANYTCPPGRRYGADYYDERMKATRKVDLEPPTSTKNVEASSVDESSDESTKRGDYKRIFTIKPATSDSAEEPSELTKGENQSHSSDAFTSECEVPEECDPKAEDSTTSSGNPGAQEPTETKPRSSEKTLRSSDPIRWYGILVSPFLRSAQKSFTEAVGGPLPELASVVVEMQAVEKEVKIKLHEANDEEEVDSAKSPLLCNVPSEIFWKLSCFFHFTFILHFSQLSIATFVQPTISKPWIDQRFDGSLGDCRLSQPSLPMPIGPCTRETWFHVEIAEWHLFLNLRRTVDR